MANFMRLSLLKAAHAVMSGAAYRKSGSPILFNPCTRKSANMGTRPGGRLGGKPGKRRTKQTTFRKFSHNGRTHITSRTNFLVLSLLGHVGLARVRSTLSPWLSQNSPHPPPPVSLLARMVLSGWPSFSVHSYRFTDRCAGRRAAVRPYDTAPDLYVCGAPAALVGRSGGSILAFAATLAAPRHPWPPFSHGVVAPAIPPPHPSRLRLAGNEYRLSRLAYSRRPTNWR